MLKKETHQYTSIYSRRCSAAAECQPRLLQPMEMLALGSAILCSKEVARFVKQTEVSTHDTIELPRTSKDPHLRCSLCAWSLSVPLSSRGRNKHNNQHSPCRSEPNISKLETVLHRVSVVLHDLHQNVAQNGPHHADHCIVAGPPSLD